MQPRYFALSIAVVIFFLILELIRSQRMTFKYSLFWFSASVAMILLSLQEKALGAVAALAGFELTSNFIFFLALVILGVLGLFLTVYVNEQNSRTEKLAQSVGILSYEISKLRKELEDKTPKNQS